MKNSFLNNFIFLLIISFCFSCTPMSKITFLNQSEKNEWNISPTPPKHYLEIGDILLVRVISRNEESNNLFNLETKFLPFLELRNSSPTL